MTVEAKLEILESKLTALSEKYAAALTTIADQSARIADLEAQLLANSTAKSVAKTSKNSHLPPSVDLGRKNQSLRTKSGKSPGGQPGHKGSTLKMSDRPDEIRDLRPLFCNGCGASLSGLPAELIGRRQVTDIPPIVPITTEYRNYSVTCTCGHHQKGDFPQGVTNHVQYGENIQALVVYNSIYQLLPFQRLQSFFRQATSVRIGKGTLENIIRRTADKAQNTYETLRKVVEVSFFVGSDETGAKLNGAKLWFWVWQNALVTYMVASCSRSRQVIEDTFPQGLPKTILCSDRLAAQLSTCTNGSQICLAHLLRDINYIIETEKTPWASDFKTLLKDALELKRLQTHYSGDDVRAKGIERRADELLGKSLEELAWTTENQHATITFYKAMIKLRHALFPFLYHREVPPDNNGSERAIRLIKVKTKISGQFKSLHHEFAVLRSVIDTAVKNGQPVFNAVKAIVNIPHPKSAG